MSQKVTCEAMVYMGLFGTEPSSQSPYNPGSTINKLRKVEELMGPNLYLCTV